MPDRGAVSAGRSRGALAIGSLAFAGALAGRAHAGEGAVATAPPGRGQPALAVGFDEAGALRARTCAAKPCAVAGGLELALPAEARPLVSGARLHVVRIGRGRTAIHVYVPDSAHERAWEAVVAAPIAGAEPVVAFQGWTGRTAGEHGERGGASVSVSEPDADGHRSVLVGEEREDVTVCGRRSLLAPRVLDPETLRLSPVKLQRLSVEERERAPRLALAPAAADAPAAVPGLLRATAASGAIGDPAALTDGDAETAWAENRGGDGRGEFVVLTAPAGLALSGLELVLVPARSGDPLAVAPRELWLATESRLFHVTVPDEARHAPGARWAVALDPPLAGECLAVVLEAGFEQRKDAHVTIAEVAARTALDGASPEALAGALAGGGERARAASVVLRSGGEPAFRAVAAAFASLDEAGRALALDVLDHAPCEVSARPYADALLGASTGQRTHAEIRLRRCGAVAAAALAQALARAPRRESARVAGELAVVAPGRAVEAILARIAGARRRERRALRVVLARAVAAPSAAETVTRALESDATPAEARLEVLRAIGVPSAPVARAAAIALARLGAPSAPFRTRYLLLEPAGALGADRRALDFVRAALRDQNPHLRAQAARAVRDPRQLPSELLRALDDPAVRVREAAAERLGDPRAGFAQARLRARLRADPWPLVRVATATALAHQGADRATDRALVEAAVDDAPSVRAAALLALGARGASEHLAVVRERFAVREEAVEVRVAAAQTLGLLCDTASLTTLTPHALALADPMLPDEARAIGLAALDAVARLQPADAQARLAPLLGRSAPPPVRRAARMALARADRCRAPARR
ncbi:MAG: HEAT repeat domain-containing protein [Polyangiaceae bacterium]|nr:HEAT repeat domain-containing protein [Polyangiaceae bacterium]